MVGALLNVLRTTMSAAVQLGIWFHGLHVFGENHQPGRLLKLTYQRFDIRFVLTPIETLRWQPAFTGDGHGAFDNLTQIRSVRIGGIRIRMPGRERKHVWKPPDTATEASERQSSFRFVS
jgi:hypothetical protein